jgi:predicted dehydrogenase
MSTPLTISASNADQKLIRVGLIGVGNWALNGPLRVLDLMPQYEMTAVYSQRPDAAQSAADSFGIRHVASSIEELVNRPDVDIVLVLTTGPQHDEAVRATIAAGKAVYCEWPLTPNSKTSAALVELADEAGVQTILGTQRRFAPGLRYLKDLLADGYVGRVRSVRMHVTVSSFGKSRSKALRWSAFPENFMGVTSIFGAHLMDPLFSIVGRPTEISAVSINQWPEITITETGQKISTEVPDQLLLQGLLASGAVFAVHIEGGKHHGTGVQIDITGDDGDLQVINSSAFGDVGENYNLFGARAAEAAMAPLPVPASYDWLPPSDLPSGVLELADLFEVHARDLENGTRTVPTFEDALFMQRLLEQAAISSATGQRIKL